jgi:ribosomal protein L17
LLVSGSSPLWAKSLCAILNAARLKPSCHRWQTLVKARVLAQVKTELVEQLPIVYDRKREKEVVALVDKLISTKRSNHEADVSEVEKELDLLVCQIYGLSESEINQVLALTGL